MADTFKKVEGQLEPESDAEDTWKDVQVEKEHQPEKEKSNLTYRQMEKEVENTDNDIIFFTKRKAVLEAEMLQVKTAAEAE